MRLAGYDIHTLHAGDFMLDGGAMFGVVPKPLWEKECSADSRNRIQMTCRCLLLQTPNRKILVDAGIGHKEDAKFADIFAVDFSRGNLISSLASLGVKPTQITDVIYTHLHFDHAGGTTELRDGKAEPLFPNARHYVQSAQYQHAKTRNPRDRASYMDANFEPVREAGLLEFLDGDVEIFPGVHVLTTSGHSPSLQMVLITDRHRSVFFPCDLIPMSAHIPLPYVMGYDLLPLTSLVDKERWLNKAADGNWTIVFEHDRFTEACTVRRYEGGRIRKDRAGSLDDFDSETDA
ncbi:MBL fold metallo-hydrolase [bacterium]|nr:MBL fold metallo-hydrolase [bacterium]